MSIESAKVNRCLSELSEAIAKNEELTELATRITGLGLHQMWLGQELQNRKMEEIGEHFYRLGGELQAICNSRL
jgi:hypothetical protein